MDHDVVLSVVASCETERKLLAIPAAILETAWKREAQIEAVIDAVLHTAFVEDPKGYVHARHVGEWCARIAADLPCGPNPSLSRRVGVLKDIDPAVLERLPETSGFACCVREFQESCFLKSPGERTTTTILAAVADEFVSCTRPDSNGFCFSPRRALEIMRAGATASNAVAIAALERAVTHGGDIDECGRGKRWLDGTA